MERINKTCRELKQIIDALLSLSQLTRRGIAYQNVDLSAIARSIADKLKKTQPERYAEFVIAPDVAVKGDEALLTLVLENLLGNAWKFTAKHPRARIEFGVARTDFKSVYFVRDDGIGFDMKYAQGPFLPPVVWFLVKLALFMFFYIWLRATFPRLRYDQLMAFGWKVLLPASLLNLAVTGVVLVLRT